MRGLEQKMIFAEYLADIIFLMNLQRPIIRYIVLILSSLAVTAAILGLLLG